MLIIGVDPGPMLSSFVAFNGERVVFNREVHADQFLGFVAEHVQDRAVLAVEWIESFGMAVGQEVFQTVYRIGSLATIAKLERNPVRLIPRRDVKLHLCNSSRAKDKNVRQALLDRFGPVGTMKNRGPLYGISSHAWSALAVAVTAHDCERTDHEASFHVG